MNYIIHTPNAASLKQEITKCIALHQNVLRNEL